MRHYKSSVALLTLQGLGEITVAVPRGELNMTIEGTLSVGNKQVIKTDQLFGWYKANLQLEGGCDNDNTFFPQSAQCWHYFLNPLDAQSCMSNIHQTMAECDQYTMTLHAI